MAAPNLISVTTITGKTDYSALTTVTANVVVNSSSSSKVVKLNTVILTNRTGSTVGANVIVNRSATLNYIGGSVSVPANSSLVLLAKDTVIYLEEGDTLQADVTANSAVTMTASYELIS